MTFIGDILVRSRSFGESGADSTNSILPILGTLEGGFVFEFLTTKDSSFYSICRYLLASLKISTEVYFLLIVF